MAWVIRNHPRGFDSPLYIATTAPLDENGTRYAPGSRTDQLFEARAFSSKDDCEAWRIEHGIIRDWPAYDIPNAWVVQVEHLEGNTWSMLAIECVRTGQPDYLARNWTETAAWELNREAERFIQHVRLLSPGTHYRAVAVEILPPRVISGES